MDFPLSLYYVISMSLCLFPLPSPYITVISPPSTLAKLKQCFLWRKNTKAKDTFLSTRAKTGFESFGYREYLRDQLLLRRKIMLCFPLWSIQGAWTRPKLWITRRKTAKSCPKLFISALYLVYTLNKYHVNHVKLWNKVCANIFGSLVIPIVFPVWNKCF